MIILLAALFFCFPFAMLLYSIGRIRQWQYRAVIMMFFVLGGYLLIPYANGDIRIYSEKLHDYSFFSFGDFMQELGLTLIGKGSVGFEFFVNLNVFLVSRFSDNVAYAFGITAFVVFLAWQAIVMRLVKEYDQENDGKKNSTAILLLIFFGLYIIFFRAINGRFYIAYWVFIFAFYKIVADKKYGYHALLLCTIFIHQSFVFLNLLVILYRLMSPLQKIKRFEIVLYVLIAAGTIFAQTGLTLMNEYLSNLGGDLQDRYAVYTSNHYIEKMESRNKQWFIELRNPLLFYALTGAMILARFSRKIKFDEPTTRIYYFVLIFWVINAFTINVESFGDRFRNVLMGVLILLLFQIYNTNRQRAIPAMILVVSVAFIFYKTISIRILGGYINMWLFSPFSILMNEFGGPVPLQSS